MSRERAGGRSAFGDRSARRAEEIAFGAHAATVTVPASGDVGASADGCNVDGAVHDDELVAPFPSSQPAGRVELLTAASAERADGAGDDQERGHQRGGRLDAHECLRARGERHGIGRAERARIRQ
jgi:hypothetical protein